MGGVGGLVVSRIEPGTQSWSYTQTGTPSYTKTLNGLFNNQNAHDLRSETYYGYKRDSRRFTLILSTPKITRLSGLTTVDGSPLTTSLDVLQPFSELSLQNNGFSGAPLSSSYDTVLMNDSSGSTNHPGFYHMMTGEVNNTYIYITVYSGKNWDNFYTEGDITGYEVPGTNPSDQKKKNFLENSGQPKYPLREENQTTEGVTDSSGGMDWEPVNQNWWSEEV